MATSSAHDDGVPRMVALCYVRQSVTRQGVPQRSPEQQRANIEAVCAQHGWQPLWFVEAEGHRSGFGEAQRPAWRRLKERLHLPGVAALVANWPEYGGLVGVKRAKDRIPVVPDAFAMAFVPEHTLFPAALLERVAAVAAQRRQVHRCRAPAHTLALSGLCRCAHCAACADGSPALHLHSHWRRGVPHYIHPPGTHCHAHTRSRPAEHVEHEVGRLIDLLCLPAEALTALVRQANSEREDTEDGEYHRQRVILEARLARIRELYLTLEMDQAEYRARTAACREALHKLDTRPTAAEQGVALQACAQDIEQLHIAWRSGTNAEHNTALRRVFQDITVDLESGHITAFHLDVLAAPYLIACAEHARRTVGSARTPAPITDGETASGLLLTHLYPATSPVRPVSRKEAWAARNRQLHTRYTQGETLSNLAHEFHLSPQRVHQIVHEDGCRKAPAEAGLLRVA